MLRVHLAACPDDLTPFDAPGGVAESNIMGVYNVCDACRTAGVSRLMLTSSTQAIGGLEGISGDGDLSSRAAPVTVADGVAPTNHYALTKAFAELIGPMYARGVVPRFPEAGSAVEHRMSVVITRVGWFVRNTAESTELAQIGAFSVRPPSSTICCCAFSLTCCVRTCRPS